MALQQPHDPTAAEVITVQSSFQGRGHAPWAAHGQPVAACWFESAYHRRLAFTSMNWSLERPARPAARLRVSLETRYISLSHAHFPLQYRGLQTCVVLHRSCSRSSHASRPARHRLINASCHALRRLPASCACRTRTAITPPRLMHWSPVSTSVASSLPPNPGR